MTEVERALRRQRQSWAETCQRSERWPGRFNEPRRLLLFGLGSSGHAAQLCAAEVRRARGSTCEVLAGSPLQVDADLSPRPGDCAIGFSHRAKNGITLNALKACRGAGARTALVAADGQGEGGAEVVLATGPLERCEPHTAGLTAAICAATVWWLGQPLRRAWEQRARQADPALETCRSSVGEGPAVILGHGAAEWAAREGALKFVEMSRRCVQAHGSEEFFHGWSFSLTPTDRVWHLTSADDPRAGQSRAARTLDVDAAQPLGWLPALLELQWLALALSLNLGLDPDRPLSAADSC